MSPLRDDPAEASSLDTETSGEDSFPDLIDPIQRTRGWSVSSSSSDEASGSLIPIQDMERIALIHHFIATNGINNNTADIASRPNFNHPHVVTYSPIRHVYAWLHEQCTPMTRSLKNKLDHVILPQILSYLGMDHDGEQITTGGISSLTGTNTLFGVRSHNGDDNLEEVD